MKQRTMRKNTPRSWDGYMRANRSSPPHREVRQALALLSPAYEGPRVAVELGCGCGGDSLLMQRAGFLVHAVDWNSRALRTTRTRERQQIARARRCEITLPRIITHQKQMCRWKIPSCSILVAYRSLGFETERGFKTLLGSIPKALATGGVLVVQFFGPRDSWVKSSKVRGMRVSDVRRWLKKFKIISLTQKEVRRPSVGGPMKHWHEIFVIAQKR